MRGRVRTTIESLCLTFFNTDRIRICSTTWKFSFKTPEILTAMNWFIDVNKDHLIVILVMWLFLLMWFLCKSFCQMIAKSPEEQHIRQKGLETIKDTKKENPKFLLIPIFSNPSANFNLTGKITVHILYEKNPHIKEQIKLARIDLDGSRAETVRQLCCCLFYRWYVWFERKRYMPPITHVQAGHDSAKGRPVNRPSITIELILFRRDSVLRRYRSATSGRWLRSLLSGQRTGP